ncbi:hypothetical protein [uncultured Kordia sp.]|uniref:hypothetical protein n=1 Tax=uncultured Kordia sp. TaxID=507699 RepID=UPI002628C137|nr:hypothetical protein [uncultured Kordia sp.]
MKLTPYHFVCFLTTSIFLYSCKNDPKTNNTPTEDITQKIDTTSKVTIVGKSDDAAALEYLNILDFSNFGFSSYQKPKEKDVFADSLKLDLFKIQQPQLMDLMAFSDNQDTIPYFTRIFVTPGDRISMNIKNGKIQFSGKNSDHYNFFLEMNDPLRQQWAVYKQDPNQYQTELELAYKKKDGFLENYIYEHPKVSDSFKKLVPAELHFEYLYNLMLPRNVEDQLVEGNYTNSSNTIVYEYAMNNFSEEKLFDFKSYFGNITVADFQHPELINNDYFKRSLVLYIRHYFVNHEYLDYSRKNFLDEKNFIQKNFDGAIENYAIGRLINDYYTNGFGTGKQDIDIIKNLIKEYEVPFSEPSFSKRMDRISSNLDMYDFEIPTKVLNEKLLTFNGDTITVRRILEKRGNNIKAIDFWVTCSAPGILDIKQSRDFRHTISKQKGIEFIYFAVDEDKNEWMKHVERLKDYVNKEQQYLILNGKTSKIVNYMVNKEQKPTQWYTVPRYSILSSNNKVISNNCPRASDSINFRKVIEQIKQ